MKDDDDDARLEQFEKELRSKRRASEDASAPSSTAAQQSGKPRWEKNQLVPEGWENMSVSQKATQLYMGERGLLFWINKLAVRLT